MLLHLRIENFALIEELDLDLEPGLNVLTGETGAGKSILIDAIGLLLGQRASPSDVRTGAAAAYVEGVFAGSALTAARDALAEFGIEADDTLVIARQVAAEGRSLARVQGRALPLRALSELGRRLVDIHGQSDHQSLFQRRRQLEYLDRFGGLVPARAALSVQVGRLRATRAQIDDLQRHSRETAREIDLLRFQVDEIDSAQLESDEDVRLDAERRVLANATHLQELAARAAQLLEQDEPSGALDLLAAAQPALEEIAGLDPAAGSMSAQLAEAHALVADLAQTIAGYAEAVDVDPARLAEVNARLDFIDGLQRKYGDSAADVLAFATEVRTRLGGLESSDQQLHELDEERQALEAALARAAVDLSARRDRAATRLARAVVRELADLLLPDAAFDMPLAMRADPNGLAVPGAENPVAFDASGIDAGEFRLSVNPGQPPLPLAQVASGGEMSRVLLGLKSVLAGVDETPTLIFDEIDAGIGGRAGDVIGQKLSGLAGDHQVLCITHLATVAAFADAHFAAEKTRAPDSTETSVRRLAGAEIVDELAAMNGALSAAGRRVARDLRKDAAAWKAALAAEPARSA